MLYGATVGDDWLNWVNDNLVNLFCVIHVYTGCRARGNAGWTTGLVDVILRSILRTKCGVHLWPVSGFLYWFTVTISIVVSFLNCSLSSDFQCGYGVGCSYVDDAQTQVVNSHVWWFCLCVSGNYGSCSSLEWIFFQGNSGYLFYSQCGKIS